MKTTRRTFLRLSGAASVFNIVPSSVLGRTAPSNKIVMGIIGAGSMGTANMDTFLGMDDVVVKAVCDVNAHKMQAAKARVDSRYKSRGCEALTDFRQLCARADIDAVMIATPDHWHAPIGIFAASQGKDIYGEKPFSHKLAEGRALVDAITRNGCVWQTGSWQRSHSLFRKAAAAVRHGQIGKVTRVEVGLPGGGRGPIASPVPVASPAGLDWKAWLGPAPERAYQGVCDFHWRWVSAWGGGILADWIGHHGDIAQWGLGRDTTGPVLIEGHGDYTADGLYDTATSFSFRCVYRDGVEMTVADGGRMEKGVGVRWIGRDGEWLWVSRGACEASSQQLLQDILGSDETVACERGSHHRNFIECIKTRQSPVAPAEAAHRAASLGHLGQVAMRTGRAIRWNPEAETVTGDPSAAALLGCGSASASSGLPTRKHQACETPS